MEQRVFHFLNVGHSAEIVFLLLFICGLAATTEEACPVEIRPSSAIVEYGHSFIANCSRLSDQVDGMGWESKSDGVPLKHGVSYVLLNVSAVKEWNFLPGCFINLVDGGQCERQVDITVYKTPDNVRMSEGNIGQRLVEGRNYSVECAVTNVAPARNLHVSWHFGNKVLQTQTFADSTVSPVNLSSIISVVANRNETGSEIWCEAKLVFEAKAQTLPATRSNSVKANVLYPPTLASPETEELEFSSTLNMTLNCTATGNPPPVYTWKFPLEVQQTTEKKHVNESVVTPSHQAEGTYVCTASNSQGKVSKTFIATQKPRSLPGTTAAILVALFFLLISIMACVVYRKQRNSIAERPEGLSK